jgi:drug/metabolite transporter (DMT)-like permease
MSATVIMLALLAAALHATWNAVLRTGADRLWTVTVMSFAMTIVALPFAFVLPAPPPSAWPYLILSSCFQVGYSVILVAAYRYGELGQVYPIVRGSVPLLVTLGGFLLAGQRLTTLPALGVILVAIGIMSLALGKGRARTASILWALATGFLIASYTTIDAMGVRAAGNPAVYAVWISLIYGTLLPAAFVVIRGRLSLDIRSPETWKALAGGVVSLMAYGAVIAAFALGPVGPITALRETSVVFAALIGRLFLGESLMLRRVTACAVVALGAVCLGYRP